ncbi:MAG: hypothetical protein DDT33_01365 [Firmicutes bacterium]|nr:hypothetical protein [Bacillota bacterium]
MNQIELSHVKSIVKNMLEQYLVIRKCPNCECYQSMIIVSGTKDEDEEDRELLRCLGCLRRFKEELEELTENPLI